MSSPVFDPLLGEMVLHEHAASATPPGGSDTQMQYNNAGVLGGTAELVFDGTYIKFPSLPTSDPFVEGAAWNSGGTLKISNGAPFDPSSISGLKLWLKADAITGLSDGDAVTTWSDSSGQGNNAGQGTASKKPTYKTAIKNGLAIVRFDGTDDFLRTSSGVTLSQPNTIFAVVYTNDKAGDYTIIDDRVGATRNTIFQASSSGYYSMYAGAFMPSATDASATWSILTCTFNGASSAMRRNGATIVSGNPGTNALVLATIGANYIDTALFNGDHAEILVYNALLSAGEISQVESYLNDKWAVY